ncbi:MAG: GTP-binding protein [Flintibacter sp.]|uniref:CobW family GTP-binding protein n=1 Tax=Flintibacter TaxID=1918454 RepID=UPI001F3DCD1E|nr:MULTISPECIES: CobW family GTP-binding protein [Eubacteriales]MDY5038669.1 CobW family GTP-binding protein [Lawsonibacter sp.]MCF2675781.1 GTP-binding protein [Pseudoflavonifractor phocaeensis]MCI6149212.1 GTP-binding protein [Flintibacter sp.]MCI7158598.1 GTP-binding protein [Flintibacter sp.]MCI7660160.1 GTP-binding protein [Flintibacter sp.]
MTKIDIVSGFLGAGKTTLIKKLLDEVFRGEKIVLIENEFGQIGIDGGFLKDAGVEITEMNSGCICCSLVGDFGAALKQVLADYAPDRIVIEPSGVGKLSDVIAAVERVQAEAPDLHLNSFVTVVDATKAKIYMKNFGEFFNNQVEHASAILLSRTQKMDEAKLNTAVKLLRDKNAKAAILTTPWDQLTGAQILSAMEGGHSLAQELMEEIAHQHHHHEHDEHCDCGCHDHDHEHHHHDHEHEDEHHHHDHDEHCDCGCHDHDHDHHHHEHEHDHSCDEAACDACLACDMGHEHHHHHHDHDADEVFTSWGRETPRKYSREDLQDALSALAMGEDYGVILRAKGILPCDDGQTWLHFDLVPGEFQIREGAADYTGRLCVIGSDLKEEQLEKLFLLA